MGFPSKGTPKDKRLNANKPKTPPTKKMPFGGKKAPAFPKK